MEETFETCIRKRPLKVFLGLLLGLSASAQLSGLSAESTSEDGATPVLRSIIIQNEQKSPQSPTVNTEDVRVLAPGTSLSLFLLTEISADESAAGDEFFGKISKDVLVDGQVVVPRGTQIHGVLSSMEEAKRAGRNGYITARFDYLLTPDGRKVPIEGSSTTHDSKGKAAAKVVGRAAGFSVIGGVVGTVLVLKYGSLAVAASNGSALAGGAAVGGAAGLTVAMLTKGKSVLLQPGDELEVKLSEPLNLPTMTMPDEAADDFAIPGLKVNVEDMRVERHPFGEMSEVTLTLDILNQTEDTFSTFEIGLEDELGNLFFPSPFDGGTFSKILPSSHSTSTITFNVANGKCRHKLVFFKPFSRDPLTRITLTDSMLANGKPTPKSKRVATERLF